MYRAQARAGLPRKGPHILRHTFCSHLAMRGAHPVVIQRLAGHASAQTTEVYMHLTPAALQEAIGKLREDDEGEDE
ncbi:MAG: tyrosine-type recombinase/integrase [Myxococcales bacterium]|nr:tyrosine-type recombinase/integrase [Myxococcales bacterium]